MAEIRQFGANFNEVNINKQKSQEALDKAKNVRVDHFDIMKPLEQGTELALKYDDAQSKAEAKRAKADYLNMITSQSYRDATATGKADMWEVFYEEKQGDSDKYKDALLAYSSGEYSRQYDGRNQEEILSKLNTVGDQYALVSDEMEPSEFVEQQYQLDPRISRAEYNQAIMAKQIENWEIELASVSVNFTAEDDIPTMGKKIALAEQELNDVLRKIEEEKKKYKTPYFLDSKAKAVKAVNDQNLRQLEQIAKAKQQEIKEAHYTVLGVAVESKYRVPPQQLLGHFKATSNNDYAYVKAVKAYEEKYNERIQADTYNFSYGVGEAPGNLPDNPLLKEERQVLVTQTLTNDFAKGDAVSFVRHASGGDLQLAKDFGSQVLVDINTTTDKEQLANTFNKLRAIEVQPGGGRVLNNMFTPKEYARIKAIEAMAIVRGGDLVTSRNYIDQRLTNPDVKVTLDPNIDRKMREYATKLGPQAANYLATMHYITQIDPSIAEDNYKDIYKHFKSTQTEKADMKVDASLAEDATEKSLDPELATRYVKEGMTNNPTSIKYLPGNIVVGKDEYGGIVEVTRITDEIEQANNNYTVRQQVEREKDIKALNSKTVTKDYMLTTAKYRAKALVLNLADEVGNGFRSIKDFFTDDTVENKQVSIKQAMDGLVLRKDISPELWDSLTQEEKNAIMKNEQRYRILLKAQKEIK